MLGKWFLTLSNFALTIDVWTSRANHSYLSASEHYINKQWKLQAHVLDAHEFPADNTGVNLASELEDILAEWKLPSHKLIAATTNNCSKIVLAIGILEWEHVRCFSHTLQLGVKAAMNILEVSKALAHARRLVSHFHHSRKSSYLLKQKQRALKHAELSLVQVCRQTISTQVNLYGFQCTFLGAMCIQLFV